MGGGFAGTMISRRGAEFFDDGFTPGLSTTNRGINPLATVFAVRLGICSDWLYARTQCHESRDKPARYNSRRFWHLGGTTSVSSGTAAIFAYMTNRP